MFITLSFKKSLIVEQFQGNYLTITMNKYSVYGKEEIFTYIECKTNKHLSLKCTLNSANEK